MDTGKEPEEMVVMVTLGFSGILWRHSKSSTCDDDVSGAVPQPVNDGTRETLAAALQRHIIPHPGTHQLVGGHHARCNYIDNTHPHYYSSPISIPSRANGCAPPTPDQC